MADSKNDSKKIHTTEDTSKTRTTADTGQSVDGERLHRPQSFQKLPSPSKSDTGQQESGGSDKTDTTSNDSSTSKSDSTSNDSSTNTDKK